MLSLKVALDLCLFFYLRFNTDRNDAIILLYVKQKGAKTMKQIENLTKVLAGIPKLNNDEIDTVVERIKQRRINLLLRIKT